MASTPPLYPPPFFQCKRFSFIPIKIVESKISHVVANYPIPTNYAQLQTQPMPNQQVPPQQQPQYSIPTGAPQSTQIYQQQPPPIQHQPIVRLF
jgi:hypothetical protein